MSYFILIFAIISFLVHFIPKGDLKDNIRLALLIVITPFLIMRIIKAFKENTKKENTRIITDVSFITLILIIGYLSSQSEY